MTKKQTSSPNTSAQCICGSFKIAKIIYGMPSFSSRSESLKARGKIVYGGCCIGANTQYRCITCGREYYQRPYPIDPDWNGKISVNFMQSHETDVPIRH